MNPLDINCVQRDSITFRRSLPGAICVEMYRLDVQCESGGSVRVDGCGEFRCRERGCVVLRGTEIGIEGGHGRKMCGCGGV